MRASLTLAFALTVAVGCTGIYGDVSDLENKVGVHESAVPADMNAEQYAVGFGFGGNVSSGVDFITVGNSQAGVGLLSFDADGSFTSSGQLLPTEITLDTRPPVAALSSADGMGASVLVGMRRGDGTGFIGLFSPSGLPGNVDGLSVDRPVSGLAIGTTGIATGTLNAVAVGTDLVTHVADYENAATPLKCDLAGAKNVAVADFVPGGDLEVALINGTSLVLLDPAGVLTDMMPCPLVQLTGADFSVEIDAAGGEGFADNVLVADFDGNGAPDVAVSHHSADKVYAVLNPDGTAAPTVVSVGSDKTGALFGTSIAAGDLDGDGADELIVGASNAGAGDQNGAGAVEIYKLVDGAFAMPPTVLNAAEPANGDTFGRSVGVATFEGGKDVILVGADKKVFVYFREPVGNDDPRTGR